MICPDLQALSPWNQTSLRSYTQNILCFPFRDGKQDVATTHLRRALDRLAVQRPDFAGRLHLCPKLREGQVCLRQHPNQNIPLDVVDIRDEFELTYGELADAAFPPGAFVHERFTLTGGLETINNSVPVFLLRAYFIRGGLLLSVAFHHAFSDGDCARVFLECLAAQTRRKEVPGPSDLRLQLQSPADKKSDARQSDSSRLAELAAACPEYAILPETTGPTTPVMLPGGTPMNEIPKTGKVFVFRNARLRELASAMAAHSGQPGQTPPSTYTCLAALTWAHIARARLDTEAYLEPAVSSDEASASSNGTSASHSSQRSPAIARLYNPVNWKSRVRESNLDSYFGNATAVPMTHFSTDDLLSITETTSATPTAASHSRAMATLSHLAQAIRTTIRGVDDDFVRKRIAFFDAVQDPRLVGIAFDPRSPQDLGFNTWRYFAADTLWHIPGVLQDQAVASSGRKPDAICRAQPAWNMGGALILPARAGSQQHDLLVTLPVVSMERLCEDAAWMSWVDKVVG